MAIGGIKKTKLNKNSILDKISEYDIFKYYMPDSNWNMNIKTYSPFREEKTPSFIISQGHHGLTFYDFGDTSKKGDCFAFIKMLYMCSNYDEVLISRSLSVPQIWVAFYQKYDPTEIQEASKEWLAYEKEGLVAIDQLGEYRLGKYVFGGIDLNVLRESTQKILIVGEPEEFKWETNTLKTIVYPDGKPAYSIMDNTMLK